MNAPSKDIVSYLLQQSAFSGMVIGTDIFIGREPSAPDNVITIYDTVGSPPHIGLEQADKYAYPSIQIRVRHMNYLSGYELGETIQDILHGAGPLLINNTMYTIIKCVSGVAFLEWDQNRRAIFVLNFNLQRRE